ncbi:MAG: tetratricopeptide repeat protein [Phycisphaerae bacterium]|jgi:Tfp pilus assembly protein PilF|nr:tetratricopeptide repeat protein [Phycisphaerae bacterium]
MRITPKDILGCAAVPAIAIVATLAFVSCQGPNKQPGPAASLRKVTISYPLDQTLFPADIAAPTFHWRDASPGVSQWRISVNFADGAPMEFRAAQTSWAPEPDQWTTIKKRSAESDATVTIQGVTRPDGGTVVSSGEVSIRTSRHEVGAPIFYREVNLPFSDAIKDPSTIRWRFGSVSSRLQPPIILEKLPVCGNCHSFTSDGRTLAMDVDYANSKGSYVITQVAQDMTLATSDVITWNDYKKEDGEQTFGLLSQISPDGRFVLSTVKDKSVFVAMPELAYSQLFFPVRGILAVHRRDTKSFHALPGADDPQYVQSNPCWSPDGKTVVFARSKAHDFAHTKGEILLTREQSKEFAVDGKPFKFDLYALPFNDGSGGEPKPLEGASNNGMSNYFPKYSPDGKWIVFCKSRNYMLLQPDSKLYIIPSAGGRARALRCNTDNMNSWHSWSPNGKWLVFSSKANTPYTQLFLTHIDDNGQSTPPVVLDRFTSPKAAANIPEFINASSQAIVRINQKFMDDHSMVRVGDQFFRAGDANRAIPEYRKALEMNPKNAEAQRKLGFLLYNVKREYSKGMTHLAEALRLSPNDPRAHHDIGMAMLHQMKLAKGVEHLTQAVKTMPPNMPPQYDPVRMRLALARGLLAQKDAKQAAGLLAATIKLGPENPFVHYQMGIALAMLGQKDNSLAYYKRAMILAHKAGETDLITKIQAKMQR